MNAGRSPDASAARVSRLALVVTLAILGLTIAYLAALRFLISPVQELAKGELALSDAQMGLLQGFAVSLPVALLSLPLGRLVDCSHRVRLLAILCAASLGGSLLTAFAPDFTWLFVARMLASVGIGCAVPLAISMAADLTSATGRGRAMLVLSAGNMLGSALPFLVGGARIATLAQERAAAAGLPSLHDGFDRLAPWRELHLEFGFVGALVFLAVLALREPVRREVGEAHAALGDALRALWNRRALLIPLFIGQVSVVMADTAAGVWAAPVLTRKFGLAPEQFGGWMGAVIFGGGLLGALLGGVLCDRLQSRRGRGALLRLAIVATAIGVPAAAYPSASTVLGFGATLFVLLACGALTGLVAGTTLAIVLPNELRGIALSAFMVVGAIVGFALAPSFVTLVSTALGGEAWLAPALTIVGVLTSVAALLGFLRADRVLAREARAAGKGPREPAVAVA